MTVSFASRLQASESNPFIGYPELEGDEARRGIWLHNPPLQITHQLRNALNNSKVDYRDILPKFEIPIVASVLKLYLLELPGTSILPMLV